MTSSLSNIEIVEEKNELVIESSEYVGINVIPNIQTDVIITEIAPVGIPGKNGYLGGWAFYKDNEFNQASKKLIPSGVRTKITNNALSSVFSEIYKPVNSIWYDSATSKFLADKLGDVFLIRINIKMTAPLNNRLVTIDFDVGTSNLPIVQDVLLARGADVEHKNTFTFLIFATSTMLTNGGTIHITANGDLYIWDVSFLIQKTFEDDS